MRLRISIIVVAIAAGGCVKEAPPPAPNRILTTPDIASTGIVQHLADVFRAQTGVVSMTRAVAPSRILDEVTRWNADAVFVDDPQVVKSLQERRAARLVSTVANDDFLLVGPARDPAHVRTAATAADAFRRIYARRTAFCSAVDVERFRTRESGIWNAAGVEPGKNHRYRECRGDAVAALNEAQRHHAYALTDRATFDVVRPDRLRTLLKGTPMLRRDLIMVLVEDDGARKNTAWFFEWVMSFRGREAMDGYRIGPVKPFYVER